MGHVRGIVAPIRIRLQRRAYQWILAHELPSGGIIPAGLVVDESGELVGVSAAVLEGVPMLPPLPYHCWAAPQGGSL